MATSNLRFRIIGDDDASSAFLRVAAAAKLTKSSMDDLGSSAFGLGKLIGGAGLIPQVAAATAVVTELTTSLGAASGAAGIFGVSAAGFIKGMVTSQKSIATTQKSLDSLTKGTKSYHDALVKLHDKQKAFNQDYGTAAKGFNDLKTAYHKFEDATGQVTKGVFAKGFELLASVLPKLVPVSNAAGRAIGGLLDDLQNWTEGPAFAHLLHFFETSGPRDITAFGHILGNTLSGLGGILSNFVGPGDHAAKSLERLTANFAAWGHSKGVSDSVNKFLRYVGANGPQITSVFSSIAEAAPKIASSLGKLGTLNLNATSKFLNLVAGMPQGAFDVVVTGLFGIAAASKLIAGAGALKALATLGKTGGGLFGKGAGGVAGSIAGVQKVYVVNMQPGLGGGGGGVGGGLSTTAEEVAAGGIIARWGASVAKFGEVVGRFGEIVGAPAFLSSQPNTGTHAVPGGSSPNFGSQFVIPPSGKLPTVMPGVTASLKSIGTHLDAVKAKAAATSRSLDMIGPHSEQTSKKAVAALQAISGHGTALDAVKSQAGKASQQLDMIGPHARSTSSMAVNALRQINAALAAIHDKKFKVTADTTQAMMNVHAMQYAVDQLHNKTIIVRAIGGHVPGEPSSPMPPSSTGNVHSGSGGAGSGRGSYYTRFTPTETLMRNLVKGIRNGFVPLATAFQKLQGYISTQKSKLSSLLGARASFAGGFQSFASSIFGGNYGTDANGNAVNPDVAGIIQFQQQQKAQAVTVRNNVRKLIKLGLSPALLKQLQAAGPAGYAQIAALAGASRGQIKQLNAAQHATQSALQSAGMAAGNVLYGKQIVQVRNNEDLAERIAHKFAQKLHEQGKHETMVITDANGQWIIKAIKKHDRTKNGRKSSTSGKGN